MIGFGPDFFGGVRARVWLVSQLPFENLIFTKSILKVLACKVQHQNAIFMPNVALLNQQQARQVVKLCVTPGGKCCRRRAAFASLLHIPGPWSTPGLKP